jgi:hypothetical protein
MDKITNNKTTAAGAVAGIVAAFGTPIINVISGLPPNMKLRDLLLGIGLAIFGKLCADAKPNA